MTAIAIPVRHPTLIHTASLDDILGWMGDFVWPPGRGPVENILRLVDFGLMVILPFPMQLITIPASLMGLNLKTLGRHIDKALNLNGVSDLAARNPEDSAVALLGGLSSEQQTSYMNDFIKANSSGASTNDGAFPLTASQIGGIHKEALIGPAASAIARIFQLWASRGAIKGTSTFMNQSLRKLGTKGTLGALTAGLLGLMVWLTKVATKLVTTPAKAMLRNPGKTLLAAGAVGIGIKALSDEEEGSGGFGGWFGDELNKASDKITEGKPKTFRGRLEQAVDQTMMGAY